MQIMWKITIPMIKQVGLIITVFTVIQLGMYDSINPVYKLIEEKTGETSSGLVSQLHTHGFTAC